MLGILDERLGVGLGLGYGEMSLMLDGRFGHAGLGSEIEELKVCRRIGIGLGRGAYMLCLSLCLSLSERA